MPIAQHNKIVHKTFSIAKFCMLYIFIIYIAYSLTFDRSFWQEKKIQR